MGCQWEIQVSKITAHFCETTVNSHGYLFNVSQGIK